MRPIYAVSFFLFIAACASLTEEQCRSGDWSAIGYNDGLNGKSADYISNHFDACTKVGITPNIQAWQSGREQGLLRYCKPDNAYIIGRNGESFNQVCPANQQATLNRAYDWGAEYFLIVQEMLALTEEKFQIELIIAGSLSQPNLTPEEAAQLVALNSRIRLIELKLWQLESRRDRYAVPPRLSRL